MSALFAENWTKAHPGQRPGTSELPPHPCLAKHPRQSATSVSDGQRY